jgi:hypothetical protein
MSRFSLSAFALAAIATSASAAPVNQVAYASLTGTQLITFDDVAGGLPPGTNYDSIFESGNTAFGERFAGQTLTTVGNFDQLSGTPSGPLTLLVGAAGRNLNIYTRGTGTQVLTGLGPLGFPDFDAIGEGSFALLFDFDQSEFGFQLTGGNGGNAFISFFQRNGTLIETITLSSLADTFYGFRRDGGVKDIAGLSIWNNDLSGIAFDNLKQDVAGVPDRVVPEPASYALLASGLAGVILLRRR